MLYVIGFRRPLSTVGFYNACAINLFVDFDSLANIPGMGLPESMPDEESDTATSPVTVNGMFLLNITSYI